MGIFVSKCCVGNNRVLTFAWRLGVGIFSIHANSKSSETRNKHSRHLSDQLLPEEHSRKHGDAQQKRSAGLRRRRNTRTTRAPLDRGPGIGISRKVQVFCEYIG